MQKPTMNITHREAGLGAFCHQCQSEHNQFRRLTQNLHCMVVRVSNEHGDHEIFLCDDCIKDAQAEAEKTGAFQFVFSNHK
jgi:hypothetical protein